MLVALIDIILEILCYICITIQILIVGLLLHTIHFTNDFKCGFIFVMSINIYAIVILPRISILISGVKETMAQRHRELNVMRIVWIYFIVSFLYIISVFALKYIIV